ncbi:S8 family peptidase [Bacillus pumilus]|uniref:S8 family peptidase n=1 Tax=Bacillus pumilus TaxID=1408 RepID=UPI00227E7803|nr:S8 family peptidase [Bacillus pumilus]MCY7572952.1 peptidase S8 [Bacillus pumilus]MEC3760114.1 S8 family serine peptidase [Bacillus pumilus]
MFKKQVKSCVVVLMAIILCMAVLPGYEAAAASKGTNVNEAIGLKNGEVISGTLQNEMEESWYQITPSAQEVAKHTHMKISVKSKQMLSVSVYPSKDRAMKDDTYSRYRVDTASGETEVDFPHAWSGPYFVKVLYLGSEEDSRDEEEDAAYTIGYKGANLPPSEPVFPEDDEPGIIIIEKKYGREILQSIRTIEDKRFNETPNGQKLSRVLQKTKPFLKSKLIKQKNEQQKVYNHLLTLKSLLNDVEKNGAFSGHIVTKKEQKAIRSLFDMLKGASPAYLKKELEAVSQLIGIDQLEGKSIGYVLEKQKLVKEEKVKTNKIIFKLKDGQTLQSAKKKMKSYGIQEKRVTSQSVSPLFKGMYVYDVPAGQESAGKTLKAGKAVIKSTARKLSSMPNVEFAEPVQTYRALSNDVQYGYQWPLKNSAQNSGKKGADVKFEQMNTLIGTSKMKQTLIAVVDTGVDSRLTDLSGTVRTDLGANLIGRNKDAIDDNGHGTHVAGIIAAKADNYYSMAGLNQHTGIIPVKVLDAYGFGDTEHIALGIKHAVDKGAKVINMSLGGYYSRVIEYAMNYAAQRNVLVVVASGNDGVPEMGYPATSKYAMAIGASNRMDIAAEFSSFGKGLSMSAPGSDIPSLMPDGNVSYLSGTSMATPYVAAAAGLLLSKNPTLKPNQVRNILQSTADNISFTSVDGTDDVFYDENDEPIVDPKIPGIDWMTGHGRLNAFAALSAVELNASVSKVEDQHQKVTGKAKGGAAISVYRGKTLLGKGTAGKNGTFSVKIKHQNKNKVLHIKISKGKAATTLKTVVKKGKAPAKPKVGKVTVKSKTVKGTAGAGLTIKVKNKSKKVIKTVKTNNKGAFTAQIKPQKAKTVLYVTASDVRKRESKAVKVVVVKK